MKTIEQGDPVTSIVRAICAYAENNSQVTVDPSMSLSQALSANLTQHQVVSLRGLSLDDVLYFVYSDRLVVVQRQEGDFVIIVGYDPYYLQVADPVCRHGKRLELRIFYRRFPGGRQYIPQLLLIQGLENKRNYAKIG